VAKPRVLFVDDDESIRQTLPLILAAEGFECTAAATVPEAISKISSQPFDILLSDLNIGQPGDGFVVVGAMRRMQPAARTYILTGYPDFESALEGIRRQVDDYMVKPVDISTLIKTLKTQSVRTWGPRTSGKRASTIIRENTPAIIEGYFREIDRNPQFAGIDLPKSQRIDHVPGLLKNLVDRLEKNPNINDKLAHENSWAHGKMRRQQGYSAPMVIEEGRVLYCVIADTLHRNLMALDLSSLIPDLVQISVSLTVMLQESLRSFLAGEQIAA
jgi:ActR/RegA family two-component response regulator